MSPIAPSIRIELYPVHWKNMYHFMSTDFEGRHCNMTNNVRGFNDDRWRELVPAQKSSSESKSFIPSVYFPEIWAVLKRGIGLHAEVNRRVASLTPRRRRG